MEGVSGPVLTGTSVIGIKYKNGVMLAADCLGSYSSLARYKDVERLAGVDKTTVVGTSGDIGDMQETIRLLGLKAKENRCWEDGVCLSPRYVFNHLTRTLYARRTKMRPLWNKHVVAGVDNITGECFLGAVTHLGGSYEDDTIATGFGAYLAQPLMRKKLDEKQGETSGLGEEEAVKLLEECMRVLYCRDARSMDKIQMARVTKDGVVISEPYKIEVDWNCAHC
ncbi:MAG: 20S proteasome subunit beta 7, PSMB4 [Amphiamblys sp. WSBS2006]|nr:MAG: 20S proteasome subunit beta 7, PSMB4 [Amphiamblys sp. WSBS2006]